MTQAWYAVRILSNCEKSIHKDITDAKIECYYPKKVTWRKVRSTKRRKEVGASRERYEQALIKGYLFVNADLDLVGTEFVRRMTGVFGFVAVNGVPVRIPGFAMKKLIDAESSGDYDETVKALHDLGRMIGQTFEISEGYLAGQRVIVIGGTEHDISVSVVNSDYRAKIPVDFWRRIANVS